MKTRTNHRLGRNRKLVRRRIARLSLVAVVAGSIAAYSSIQHVQEAMPIPPPEIPLPSLSVPASHPSTITWREDVLCDRQSSPDGITMGTGSKVVFFSDEAAATISRIDADGSVVTLVRHDTPVARMDGGAAARVEGLRSPEGIAIGPDRRVYVVEDIPGGRLISFELDPEDGRGPSGMVVPVPIQAPDIAWESVAVNERNEILLAGSTAEAALAGEGVPGLFDGYLLFRDAQSNWWEILRDPMASLSCAAFGEDGRHALYTCELWGSAGAVDLDSHRLRRHETPYTFRSPECITPLPDGTALVAEEGGALFRVDMRTDAVTPVYDVQGAVESVLWDPEGQRLLVTDDAHGRVIALSADIRFASPDEVKVTIPWDDTGIHPVTIPGCCPSYLTGLLARAGYVPGNDPIPFDVFARRVSMMAVDACAEPFDSGSAPADPVVRIQFLVLMPDLFGLDLGGLCGPVSGFAAVRASGDMTGTRMVDRNLMHMELDTGITTLFGSRLVAVPSPMAARLSGDGIASVHFMGLGLTPDYHFVFNMVHPSQSYLQVMDLDGTLQGYALDLPCGAPPGHWVMALPQPELPAWTPLGPVR